MRIEINIVTGEIIECEDAPILEKPYINTQLAINSEALAYLASTDWLVTRMAENGTPIAIDVLTKRAEARLAIVSVA